MMSREKSNESTNPLESADFKGFVLCSSIHFGIQVILHLVSEAIRFMFYSSLISRETLDESPMAYKSMDAIVNVIGDTVDVTERIVPVYNFKAGNE